MKFSISQNVHEILWSIHDVIGYIQYLIRNVNFNILILVQIIHPSSQKIRWVYVSNNKHLKSSIPFHKKSAEYMFLTINIWSFLLLQFKSYLENYIWSFNLKCWDEQFQIVYFFVFKTALHLNYWIMSSESIVQGLSNKI